MAIVYEKVIEVRMMYVASCHAVWLDNFYEIRADGGRGRIMGYHIYLLRHGEPLMDGGIQRCLGQADVPLTEYGRWEVRKWREWFRDKNIKTIYTSPLKRCRQTAEIIAEGVMRVIVLEGFSEIDVGLWDNLSFAEIKEKYPKEYEERGRCLGYYAPPGGESFYQAGKRFLKCMNTVIEKQEDSIVIGHGGVNRSFICLCKGLSLNRVLDIPQPYAGLSQIEISEGKLDFKRIGYKPPGFFDQVEMEQLFRRYGTPMQVIRHMEATAAFLERLLEIPGMDGGWDRRILLQAAKVHDLAKTKKNHAATGARALREAGYPELAGLVEAHHSLPEEDQHTVSSKSLLFYADKRVLDDRVVSLETRFKASKEKCQCEEAVRKHRQLYEQALEIEKKIKELTGGHLC